MKVQCGIIYWGVRIRKNLVFFWATAAFLLFLPYGSALQGGEIKILKDGKEQSDPRLRNYLKTVNHCCQRALKGLKKTDFDITGIISPDKKQVEISHESKKELKILFPEKFENDDAFHNATREVIKEIISRKIGIATKNENGRYIIPEWIISGIQSEAYSDVSGKKAGIGITLTGAHSLAVSNSIPPLRKIIENPLYPCDGTSWELYAELCKILVEHVCTMKPGESAVKAIIELNTRQDAPYSSLVGTLKDLIEPNIYAYKFYDCEIDEKTAGEEEKMQQWFRFAVMRKAIDVFNPAPASFSSALLESTMTVKVEIPLDEGKSKTEVCKVADLPEPVKMADLKYFIARQEKYVAGIIYFSNTQLHPELRRIMKAWSLLEKGGKESFLKEFVASVAGFHAAAVRVEKIEDYLFETEKNSATPAMLFSPWKTSEERYNMRRKEIWKDLESYLGSRGNEN